MNNTKNTPNWLPNSHKCLILKAWKSATNFKDITQYYIDLKGNKRGFLRYSFEIKNESGEHHTIFSESVRGHAGFIGIDAV